MVIGAGIVSFIMLYFAFNLDKDHYAMRLITVFFALGILLIVPAMLVENIDNVCDVVVSNSTQVGSTMTYEYESFCYSVALGSPSTLFSSVMWFYRVFIAYVIGWLGYHALIKAKESYQEKGRL